MGKYTPQSLSPPSPPPPPPTHTHPACFQRETIFVTSWEMKSFQMGSTLKQSGPQDQKNVIFSHSVISLNQLPQNFKNTAHIFLTSRNHVKIFLSGYFHNVSNIVYRTTLRIRTERADKTVKTLIRLLLEEQSDQGLYYLSFYLLHLHMILQGNLNLLNFRIFSILIQVFQFLEVSI